MGSPAHVLGCGDCSILGRRAVARSYETDRGPPHAGARSSQNSAACALRRSTSVIPERQPVIALREERASNEAALICAQVTSALGSPMSSRVGADESWSVCGSFGAPIPHRAHCRGRRYRPPYKPGVHQHGHTRPALPNWRRPRARDRLSRRSRIRRRLLKKSLSPGICGVRNDLERVSEPLERLTTAWLCGSTKATDFFSGLVDEQHSRPSRPSSD
jgi:hypothetical protein